jgi:hypothetical protein
MISCYGSHTLLDKMSTVRTLHTSTALLWDLSVGLSLIQSLDLNWCVYNGVVYADLIWCLCREDDPAPD